MSSQDDNVSHPVIKAVTAFGAWAAGLNWGERAQMAAFFYTLLLIFDWWWKRFWRPYLITRGWWPRKSPYLASDSSRVPLDK